jgi:hypothetical protein
MNEWNKFSKDKITPITKHRAVNVLFITNSRCNIRCYIISEMNEWMKFSKGKTASAPEHHAMNFMEEWW